MTNKENFVITFGKESYDRVINSMNSNDVFDIFEWLLEDSKKTLFPEYKYEDPGFEEVATVADEIAVKATKAIDAIDGEIVKSNKKRRYRGSIVGRGYDLKWYMDAVSDFYLGQAKSIEFKISDDLSSGKKVNSIDGFKSRFIVAVKELELDEEIWVHKYYQGTCNECVCLEKPNFKNSKAAGYSNMR